MEPRTIRVGTKNADIVAHLYERMKKSNPSERWIALLYLPEGAKEFIEDVGDEEFYFVGNAYRIIERDGLYKLFKT